MTSSLLRRPALFSIGLLLSASAVHAGVKMNAMCYLQNGQNSSVEALNPTSSEISKSKYLRKYPTNITAEDLDTKYRIASLTKILTSHWAIAKLGPEYRFKTRIYLTPGIGERNCNLHFEGDRDPYMGRDMLANLFPQIRKILAEKKCHLVEIISYDENFRVYLDVMKHHRNESFGWNDPANFTSDSRTDKAFKDYLQYKSRLRYASKNVGPISKARYQDYLKNVPHQVYSFKSRPLHMMLKDFNKYSFNYPPEVLFERLGGAAAYGQFIQSKLNLTREDVEVYNGSGYPIEKDGESIYNLVSCSALVTIFKDLDDILKAFKGSRSYLLADIMAVGGNGETYSTFKGLYASDTYHNTMVAKTGSANLAITFGGMISTQDGNMYFAALTRPDRYGGSDLDNARFFIRDLVATLVSRKKLVRFKYEQIGDMNPFDNSATLILEKSESTTAEDTPSPLLPRPKA